MIRVWRLRNPRVGTWSSSEKDSAALRNLGPATAVTTLRVVDEAPATIGAARSDGELAPSLGGPCCCWPASWSRGLGGSDSWPTCHRPRKTCPFRRNRRGGRLCYSFIHFALPYLTEDHVHRLIGYQRVGTAVERLDHLNQGGQFALQQIEDIVALGQRRFPLSIHRCRIDYLIIHRRPERNLWIYKKEEEE